ncbi:formamidopyrimidine-DNA glycosylase [Parafrankia irregularis]|uniref:Formamidopyrimidine-DNA glycosylase n=1 Tax=Parafrankia irregularis TaxID=795642 RepID=A0A0S4QQZ1_9ACTN|nr:MULTISPECIES: DNA-formamidopyrimidine glycosylase family protein [Parafrankia]MBE3204428.1 Fpg/Nei family DNA glycosylase [Parafrankia sp. CH37]CUU57700.1 formamidopyrimidine-DNA glycosylase [Parafrankia irregularis]
MPELPEVEALAAFLRETAADLTVARVEPVAVNALKTFDPPFSTLVGAALVTVQRHGKFLDLVFAAADGERLDLVTHLARAGWLQWKAKQPRTPARPGRGPLALRVVFTDGSGFDLTEAGTQKRLAVYLVRDPAQVDGISRLGVDPLSPEFTRDVLAALLAESGRAQIKGVITDQSKIAGVGNAYSDEALWVARLSPFRPATALTATEVDQLHAAVTGMLRDAADAARGLAAADLKAEKKLGLKVHGQTGLPCPRCADTIREVSFSDRSLQYCPTCQTDGRPLADRRLSKLLK